MMKYSVIISFCNIAATCGWSFGFRTASFIPSVAYKMIFYDKYHAIIFSVINYFIFSVMNYYRAREVECFCNFGKSSTIHQTKTIQISNCTFWLIFSFTKLFFQYLYPSTKHYHCQTFLLYIATVYNFT